jgi:hypothetical protein
MKTRNRFAALAVGLAVVAVASPSIAQSNKDEVSAARAADLRDCTSRAQKYLNYLWGVQQDDIYRACMAEHHQPE